MCFSDLVIACFVLKGTEKALLVDSGMMVDDARDVAPCQPG